MKSCFQLPEIVLNIYFLILVQSLNLWYVLSRTHNIWDRHVQNCIIAMATQIMISIRNVILFLALNDSRICLIPEMLNCSSPALGKWLNLKLETISAFDNKWDKKRFEVLQSNRGICTCNVDIGRIGKGSCHDHNFWDQVVRNVNL